MLSLAEKCKLVNESEKDIEYAHMSVSANVVVTYDGTANPS